MTSDNMTIRSRTIRTRTMSKASAPLLLALVLIAGCKPAAQAGDAAAQAAAPAAATAAVAATEAATAPAAQAAIDAGFKEGMPYATLRKQLIDAGWLPLRDPECWKNAGAGSTVCGLLPEVESCSGDGYCNMYFANADAGKRIEISTYGPYERWNEPGQEAALAVKSWQVSPLDAQAAPACPSQDFDAFLKAFASNDQTERAFTAPVVKVAELGGGEDGTDTVLVYETQRSYDGFNVAFADNAFHYIDSEGAKDASPLKLDVQAQGDDVRQVRYQYGMSEGNSYMFRRTGGCWFLTQDPEPPSP